MSSFNFYPVVGTVRYELSSPQWKEAMLLFGDKTLKLIESRLNESKSTVRFMTHIDFHCEIANGGTLQFVIPD